MKYVLLVFGMFLVGLPLLQDFNSTKTTISILAGTMYILTSIIYYKLDALHTDSLAILSYVKQK